MGSVVLRPPFRDRADAGDALALSLSMFATEPNVVVLGVGRGGVPVARQVAGELGAPFDVLVSRKVGVPGIEEVALGAIAEGSGRVIPDDVAWYIGVPSRSSNDWRGARTRRAERCAQLYRGGKLLHDLRTSTVILG
jgi:putative phosphoribosyl transferase